MAKETADFTLTDTSHGISMGESGEASLTNNNPISADSEDVVKPPVIKDENQDEEGAFQEEEEVNDADGEGGEDEAPEALPEFDAENEDITAQYDARFRDEDGDLDVTGSIAKEYWDNKAAGKDGLNEGTLAYLKKAGIKEATIQQVAAMAETQAEANKKTANDGDLALMTLAGGAEELGKALEWGKKGGYSKEAQARFNKLAKGKDQDAKADAVEALMARYKAANPPKRPRVPARDATKGQGNGRQQVKGFADRAEAKAVRDALKDGDTAGWATYNRRRSASTF